MRLTNQNSLVYFFLFLTALLQIQSSNIGEPKQPIKNLKPKEDIFDFIEREMLKHPINNISHYSTRDFDDLKISYKSPSDNNIRHSYDGFDIGNSSNIYWYYKYPIREEGFSEELMKNVNISENSGVFENAYELADEDINRATYKMSLHLLNKLNSNVDEKKQALELLRSVEGNVPEALFLLGSIYENYDILFPNNGNESNKFENDLKSIAYFEQCSLLGDINCQLAMAHKHFLGDGLPRDLRKSANLYYLILKRVIKQYNSENRYPWDLSNHKKNIWNHNFFKFVNDPKSSSFEYVDLNEDSEALHKDTSILLHTKNNLPLSDGIGDLELVKVMHFLHQARKELAHNPGSDTLKRLMSVKIHNPAFENMRDLYLNEEFSFIEDEILLYVYTDIVNTINGNIFTNDYDLNYAFDLLKMILKIYAIRQPVIDSKLSVLGKYYLSQLIVIFSNIYKEYGVFEANDDMSIDLITSLYKTAHSMSSLSDEIYWEMFRFLHYINPSLDLDQIFAAFVSGKKSSGYAAVSAATYESSYKIKKLLKDHPNADNLIMNDFDLQKKIQYGMASKYLPALFQSCKLDYQILPASQSNEKATLVNKLRLVIESIRMDSNIHIFQQNFVNMMNYKNGKDSTLNLFAMAQLSSMGFEKAINNLANELIPPVKILTDANLVNKTSSSSIINAGISKYLSSYKLGNINHGLQLSAIFDNLKQWSQMLSLNYLIADTNGNFYSFYNLGRIYEDGKGITCDFEKAAEYYRKVLTYDALSSYHDMSMTNNGLEFSVNLLLFKLQVKKWCHKLGFSPKIVQNVTQKFKQVLNSLSSIEKNSSTLLLTTFHKLRYALGKRLLDLGIDLSVIWSILVLCAFALLPKVLKHLARVNGWTITINGAVFVDGVEIVLGTAAAEIEPNAAPDVAEEPIAADLLAAAEEQNESQDVDVNQNEPAIIAVDSEQSELEDGDNAARDVPDAEEEETLSETTE